MATWLLVLTGLLRPSLSLGGCQAPQGAPPWAPLECTGADAALFQSLRPNRSHWIKCADCSLPLIDAHTFPYPRNNVSYLELPQSGVASVRRRAFACFFLLKVLSLRGNRLEHLDPQSFQGLPRLLQLDLSANRLQTLNDNVLVDLASLDLLNLSRNRLVTVQAHAFLGLARLQYLYLSHNSLPKLQERMFRPLASLRILYLEHNRLVEIHQNAFAGLAQLQYLYLNNNSLDFLVQYNFRPLAGLLDLQLRGNRLREVQVSAFNGLRSLRVLHLSDNRIAHVKPYGFIGLDELRVLDLVRNRLPQVALSHFDKMPRLHMLWLNDNPIAEFAVSARDDSLEGVEVVDLSGSGLRTFDFAQLYRKMPRIKELVLVNCSLECQFFARMFDFFSARNVTVCLTPSCSPSDSAFYRESVCAATAPQAPPTTTEPPLGGAARPPMSLCTVLFFIFAVY